LSQAERGLGQVQIKISRDFSANQLIKLYNVVQNQFTLQSIKIFINIAHIDLYCDGSLEGQSIPAVV
jgi:hypothetical protein